MRNQKLGSAGTVTVDVDLVGRLRCFSLSDIIQLMSFSSQTGTLTLSQGWNSRTITFESGRITYIAAATKLPSFEELMLKAGRITEEQLAQAVAAAGPSRQSPIDVLIAMGAVDQAEVRRFFELQLEDTIYSLFLWRNCAFRFESGIVCKEGGLPIDIAAERLVMEGTRQVDEWISISPVIPSVRMIFQTVKSGGLERQSPEEQHVFRQVDGVRDVEAIAKAAGLTQFDTAKALYELVQAGLVRAVPPDRMSIIELFKFLVQSVYTKLLMYGFSPVAFEFQNELNRFAREHGLKTRMTNGKLSPTDIDAPVETTALIDLYKLFIAIENNHFGRIFEPEIVHGLVEGLYLHVDARYQDMMRMYDFYALEGLLKAETYAALRPRRGSA